MRIDKLIVRVEQIKSQLFISLFCKNTAGEFRLSKIPWYLHAIPFLPPIFGHHNELSVLEESPWLVFPHNSLALSHISFFYSLKVLLNFTKHLQISCLIRIYTVSNSLNYWKFDLTSDCISLAEHFKQYPYNLKKIAFFFFFLHNCVLFRSGR